MKKKKKLMWLSLLIFLLLFGIGVSVGISLCIELILNIFVSMFNFGLLCIWWFLVKLFTVIKGEK